MTNDQASVTQQAPKNSLNRWTEEHLKRPERERERKREKTSRNIFLYNKHKTMAALIQPKRGGHKTELHKTVSGTID